MRRPARHGGLPAEVARAAGEKPLASARASDGRWLMGTRRFLVVTPTSGVEPVESAVTRIPWEQVEDASWDSETSRLLVTEIGDYGRPRPTYEFVMEAEPNRFLQLVRERVTASVVLQRRVPVRGRLGLTLIGRRSPAGGEIRWMHAYDPGLDPDAPEVRAAADASVAAARAETAQP